MACQMARLPVTLSEAEGHFCNAHNSPNIACFTYELESTPACNLNFIVKGEGLLKVTGSHILEK